MKRRGKDKKAPKILGIDIGGSGIKGAPVDIARGVLVDDRRRIPTPRPADPATIAEVIAELGRHFRWSGPIGCTFPGVIRGGRVLTAANIEASWVGVDGRELFARSTGCPVALVNDADAAGLAEIEFGAGRDRPGVVLMVTLGTGIGSALFVDGRLVPNTELGHLVIRGKDAEDRASDRARKEKRLGWKRWARRLDEFLCYVERLLEPDLFIVGGGVSKKHEKYLPHLTTAAPVVPAEMRNEAGIVGAALAAAPLVRRR